MPAGVADLLEPRVDLLVAAERGQHRLGGLARPRERRHQDLVEDLVVHRRAEVLGLAVAQWGQRWVDDVEPVAHPFGLGVADQDDFHGLAWYGRWCRRTVWRRAR